MGMEPMGVAAEGWLLAADAGGAWLCVPRQEPSAVYSDGDPWYTAKLDLAGLGVLDPHDDLFAPRPDLLPYDAELVFLHGTSGRPDNGRWLVTHAAIADVAGGDVLAVFPDALPVTPELLEYVGCPIPHGPTTAPVPRDVDVLFHAIGHLAYLRETNGEWQGVLERSASGQAWLDYLAPLAPLLAKQYTRREREEWRAAHPAAAVA